METGLEFDYEYIRDQLARSLLRDLWDETERFEFFRKFAIPTTSDLSVRPFIGVGISESENGRTQLQILSTIDLPSPLFRQYLAQKHWEDLRFDIKNTGLAVPCARPAQGGDSISRSDGMTGTLGCAVKDRGSRIIEYFLSCNHVLAKLNSGVIRTDVIWQPGCDDGGGSDNRIGVLDKFKRIQFGPNATNLIDAALCKLDSTKDVISGIRKLGSLTGYVQDPALRLRVRKQGRTSGTTVGRIMIKNITVIIKYDTGQEAIFEKQMGVIGTEPGNFGQRGDSGSIVVDEKENAIGMLFSVTAGTDLSLVNPIVPILDEFQISLA